MKCVAVQLYMRIMNRMHAWGYYNAGIAINYRWMDLSSYITCACVRGNLTIQSWYRYICSVQLVQY